MSRVVKKVSNLFIDDKGRVNFVVGRILNDMPVYYIYRTVDERKGLEIYVGSKEGFSLILSPLVFSFSPVSLRSIRKIIYDNYDNYAVRFPMIVGG